MDKSLKWRAALVVIILVMAVIFMLPSVTDKLPSWWSKVFSAKKIGLGLDLKGGIHLVLEVDQKVAIDNMVKRVTLDLNLGLNGENISFSNIEKSDEGKIVISFPDNENLSKGLSYINSSFPNLTVISENNDNLVLSLSSREINLLKEFVLKQALETIRNRIDMFGVAEPDIRPQGEDRIVIQLPGLQDPNRAMELIGKTAVLEFRLVEPEEKLADALKNGATVGAEILYLNDKNRDTNEDIKRPYLVKKEVLVNGNNLTDARVSTNNQFQLPQVSITFDEEGSKDFEYATEKYIGRPLAIVLDNQVYSAPVIQAKISEGKAVISGNFTLSEASDLALILRSGSLPAPVKILEKRTVGPSLGNDSINEGLKAGLIGIGCVLLFMIIYYRGSGMIADLALLANCPIILAALSIFQATLTLPGIFGLVLTLGMAVDANVLIFERIREEIRSGKSPLAAVNGGFNRAFWTIFDSNITTLITAMVLYQFGSGPIRGFAVTLSIGILSSMFTAIFASRVVFDLALSKRSVKTLSI